MEIIRVGKEYNIGWESYDEYDELLIYYILCINYITEKEKRKHNEVMQIINFSLSHFKKDK